MIPFTEDPILNVQWIEVSRLNGNLWNPNVVLNTELKLLELSIVRQGWIQPILASRDLIIIDGFHRWSLSKSSKVILERYHGRVPVCILDIDEKEAICMTVRINRAKGTHVAGRMHDLIVRLIDDHKMSHEEVETMIGAYKGEVKLLYENSIWKKKNLDNYKFSQAWEPKMPEKHAKLTETA